VRQRAAVDLHPHSIARDSRMCSLIYGPVSKVKIATQVRGTITKCNKCCSDGSIGLTTKKSVDFRATVEFDAPLVTFTLPYIPIPLKRSVVGAGAGGGRLEWASDSCTGEDIATGCGFTTARLGGEVCTATPLVQGCVRGEGTYNRKDCANGQSSSCFGARFMARLGCV